MMTRDDMKEILRRGSDITLAWLKQQSLGTTSTNIGIDLYNRAKDIN